MLTIGSTLGRYRIVNLLGQGGAGARYLAEDIGIGRRVVVEVFPHSSPELVQQLVADLRAMAFNHPNVCSVFDVGEYNGSFYVVMEYLEGGSLEELLRSGRSLPIIEKLDIIRQVCLALEYAHQRGVIHGDIKPINVLVNSQGNAKIIDFGTKRLGDPHGPTGSGRVLGTRSLSYIAPERLKGEPSDGRADLWSTGVLLYQLLTNNHLPFPGDDEMTRMYKIIHEPFEPLNSISPDYPQGIERVLEKALAKDPKDRYELAEEMAADIEAINGPLKRARVNEQIAGVRQLIVDQRFATAARDLANLRKLDPQNAEIRELFQEVSEKLAAAEKSEQPRLLVSQANEAQHGQDLTEASKSSPPTTQSSGLTQLVRPLGTSNASGHSDIRSETPPSHTAAIPQAGPGEVKPRRRWMWISAAAAVVLVAAAIPFIVKHKATTNATVAVDNRGFAAEPVQRSAQAALPGKNYALLFATDNYQYWPHLNNPLSDAQTIAGELHDNYGFSNTSPQVIANPRAKDIIDTLHEYANKSYGPNDQLFIYFAGHGFFDEQEKEGFLVASDSRLQKDDTGHASYVDFSRLSTILDNIPAQHIFVVLDVCYGGAFDAKVTKWAGSRGDEYADVAPDKFIHRKLALKGRLYLTSGQITTVPDGKVGQHSPFARRFIESLRNYGGKKQLVTATSLAVDVGKLEPEPRFGEFGDSAPGADFLFVPK